MKNNRPFDFALAALLLASCSATHKPSSFGGDIQAPAVNASPSQSTVSSPGKGTTPKSVALITSGINKSAADATLSKTVVGSAKFQVAAQAGQLVALQAAQPGAVALVAPPAPAASITPVPAPSAVPVAVPQPVLSPTPIPTPVLQVAQKARLRNLDDGTKALEYLDPTSTSEKWIAFGKVETYPVGTQFHHWGPTNDVKYWAQSGIDPKDIANDIRQINMSNVIGGGFYMSLSTIDSASYGPSLLIIEPKHVMTALDVTSNRRWNRDQMALQDNSNPTNLIPMTLIQASGIEAVRYQKNWLVCIDGKALENLFEGGWDNFAAHHGGDKFNLLEFATFAGKYPLDDANFQKPEFQKNFPVIAKIAQGVNPSSDELATLAGTILAGYDYSIFSSLVSITVLKNLKSLLLDSIKSILATKMADILTSGQLARLQDDIYYPANSIGISIADISPGFIDYVSPTFNTNNWTNTPPNIYLQSNGVIQEIILNSPYVPFYTMLSRYAAGNTTPWSDQDDPTKEAPRITLQKFNGLFNAANSDRLKTYAAFWAGQPVEFRDAPAIISGTELIEGPDKPGFFIVSPSQKADLEATPWIVPRFIEKISPASGQSQIFAQFEAPSARTFHHFEKFLSPELLARLNAAEVVGDLASAGSESFKSLTQQIIVELVGQPAPSYFTSPSAETYFWARIRPFMDPRINQLAITSADSQYGSLVYLPNFEAAQIMTYPELLEAALRSSSFVEEIYFSTDSSGISIDTALGLWEIAANNAEAHKNPAAFIQAVKSRFLTDEVQAWVRAGKFGLVQKALYDASFGQ